MTKIANAGTTITDVIGGILFVIFFLEMCVGTTLTVHLPPPREPWFMKPPAIIIPMPRNPYEIDTWRNTWEERCLMEIKQSFLNSLEGLFSDQAQALVESEGFTYMGVNMGVAISQILRPDTIICWINEDGTVGNVQPGNRSQVVDDT